MPRCLVDIESLDLSKDVLPDEQIRALLPHAYEWRLIDGICHLDLEAGTIVGYKDWDENPWWARGHVPGRPLMPGVLLIEGAAQITTILMKLHEKLDPDLFIALGGLDKVRHRGSIVPPARIHFAARVGKLSGMRLARYPAEAYAGTRLVMQMELLGVLL